MPTLEVTSGQLPCPIPYQGSKRKLAPAIVRCLPVDFGRLYEPFAGSAAVSLATATVSPRTEIVLNDTNAALVDLWTEIIERPDEMADKYESLWRAQLDDPRDYYERVRRLFNSAGCPEHLLYLLARCVKAAVRYNSRGEFNQSADHRRLGSRPDRMRKQIGMASRLLAKRTTLSSVDFREAVRTAQPEDVIYMDPPYQGVSSNRDRRYRDTLQYDEFVEALAEFDRRDLSFIVSYDGRTGEKTYGMALPARLRLAHFEIDAGRSTQSTLAGGTARTVESLYLSSALEDRLTGPVTDLERPTTTEQIALY